MSKLEVYEKSFIHKVAIFSIMISLMIMSSLYLYTSSMMKRTLSIEYQNYSKNLESYLQDTLLPLIAANDRGSINHILDSLMRLEVIESINVHTFDEVIFDRDKHRVRKPEDIQSKVHPLVITFTIADMTVGHLEANLYLKERDVRSKETLYTLLFASATATLLIAVAIILFLLSIKKKLSLFEAATRSITSNHIPQPIPVQGKDEFSQMASTFNSMLWQLREKYVAMDMSPDGILIVNYNNKVTYINSALSQLLSIDSPSHSCPSLTDFDNLLRGKLNLKESNIDSLKTRFKEAVLVLNDQQHTILRCHLKYHQNPDTAEHSQVFYFVDITHEKKVERLKSEFLNTAAHELRTPLAGIYGYSELLINFEYEPTQTKDFLKNIHAQSKLLTSIIDDLLDIAKIESTKAHYIERRNDNLASILMQASDQVGLLAERKGITIQSSYPSEIIAYFDADKMRRALINLLSNAVKYSDENTQIEILYNQEESGVHTIKIRDHGIGMSEEELTRLGEKFFRADTSGSTPGTGLGVSISNQIIQLHGGTLSYESTLGSGTSAVVTLPESLKSNVAT